MITLGIVKVLFSQNSINIVCSASQAKLKKILTKTFGRDSTLGPGIHYPVIILEGVNGLQHSGDSAHG